MCLLYALAGMSLLVACGGGDEPSDGDVATQLRIEAPDAPLIGDTLRITVSGANGVGRVVPVPGEVTLTVGGEAGREVAPGTIYAVDAGTIVVGARAGSLTAERRITVNTPAQLQLAIAGADSIRLGDTTAVAEASVARDGQPRTGLAVRFSVADSAVAQVVVRDGRPTLVPRRLGATELVARLGDRSARRALRVVTPGLVTFTVEPSSLVLDVGDSTVLSAVGFDAFGAILPADETRFAVESGPAQMVGPRTMRATAPGRVVYSAAARSSRYVDSVYVVPPSQLTIDVREGRDITGLPTALSPRVRTAVQLAVRRWRRVIRDELPPQRLTLRADFCANSEITDETITGLRVYVAEAPIASNTIIAFASACVLRTDGRTLVGFMQFNPTVVARLTDSQVNETALHEFGHVLGFGSSWRRSDGFANLIAAEGGRTVWTGANARAGFDLLPGRSAYTGATVPVSVDVGHWDGAVLRSELMEPFARAFNRMSRATIGAMADMGYGVNVEAWERYFLPSLGRELPAGTPLDLRGDVIQPRGIVRYDGTVVPLP
ncbi:MAG: leishmanolysin [Gemmatimonadaceae bacterium]|nr:leishmanolysin [Gemmatimonadaceae bacterium]